MMRNVGSWGVLSAAAAALAWYVIAGYRSPAENVFPDQPVRVVVPYKAGGGTDVFARLIQRAVNDAGDLGQPLVIVNQDGGSGTIGSRAVKQAPPDGHTILCLHDGIMTAQLAGTVDYGPEAFEPIAQTGDMVLVVVTHDDAPYADLPALLSTAARRPGDVTFGTNMGSPAHYAGLLLQRAQPGVQFNFVPSGGGANRFALLAGKHLDVAVFALAEFVQFRRGSPLRALAVLAPRRQSAAADVPTAREQGVDVVSGNGLYFWAPLGTPAPRVERLAAVLKQALTTQGVRDHPMDPEYRTGGDLQDYLRTRQAELAGLKLGSTVSVPDVVTGTWLLVGGLSICWVLRSRVFARRLVLPKARSLWRAAVCMGVLVGYGLVLAQIPNSFVWASIGMMVLIGSAMTDMRRDRVVVLVSAAVLLAVGVYALFTRVLSLPLP